MYRIKEAVRYWPICYFPLKSLQYFPLSISRYSFFLYIYLWFSAQFQWRLFSILFHFTGTSFLTRTISTFYAFPCSHNKSMKTLVFRRWGSILLCLIPFRSLLFHVNFTWACLIVFSRDFPRFLFVFSLFFFDGIRCV